MTTTRQPGEQGGGIEACGIHDQGDEKVIQD